MKKCKSCGGREVKIIKIPQKIHALLNERDLLQYIAFKFREKHNVEIVNKVMQIYQKDKIGTMIVQIEI